MRPETTSFGSSRGRKSYGAAWRSTGVDSMTTRGRKQRHVITPEYPPQVGGVSDYVHQVAAKLAEAGEEVHIWCPVSSGKAPESRGVIVHQSLGTFAPSDLLRAGQQLDG